MQAAMEAAEERFQNEKVDSERRFKELLQQVSTKNPESNASAITSAPPSFSPFDSNSELWTDYYARFKTFLGAHSIPDVKQAQVFLTNQSSTVYKLLSNLAAQQNTPKDVNDLSMKEIEDFMKEQYDPKRFVVRERFRFWSDMQRKPGETIHELAARIRHDATTCDFPSITSISCTCMRGR